VVAAVPAAHVAIQLLNEPTDLKFDSKANQKWQQNGNPHFVTW